MASICDNPAILSPIIQGIAAIVASVGLYVAWRNLRGVRRSQALQAQMNLINLENEIRKNYATFRLAVHNYVKESSSIPDGGKMDLLAIEKVNAFELYVSSADKLAALINSDFLVDQFKNRDWKLEYNEIFQRVKLYHEAEDLSAPGKDQMIRNIEALLRKWNYSPAISSTDMPSED